ncbi:hypothetical protein DPMN_176078 [Dreissena polymorpha]|uniref:Uncharacterized protein n=1 Tax=Dreissena polymorpha TaxID=45954 RepID=A0A9D4E7N3_DREPO|nr:hypothetical protein DPMN_176078 [Dreissena polymorpha]
MRAGQHLKKECDTLKTFLLSIRVSTLTSNGAARTAEFMLQSWCLRKSYKVVDVTPRAFG